MSKTFNQQLRENAYADALAAYSARVRDNPSSAEGFPFSQEFRDYRLVVREIENGNPPSDGALGVLNDANQRFDVA